jgi:hypothetical protein
MKIRWCLFFLGDILHISSKKSQTHGANLNFNFVSMSKLEFYLFKGVIIENSSTMETVNFFEKIQIFHVRIHVVVLKMTSCKTMSRNKN